MQNLQELPKVRDSLSTLYLEHVRIDRLHKSIAAHDQNGYMPIPAASLSVLMLGPGSSITHAAVQTLADNNCLVVWCGEENVRFYAQGMGGTRSAAPLLLQAKLASDERNRLEVVRRMYALRFGEIPDKNDTVESLRGREGARVREAYAKLADAYGVVWQGRNYTRDNWGAADPLNRALSCANSCLYGLCHAAILAAGYSPGLGFIHTGKQLSFVYDIADLYKVEVTIPVAFKVASQSPVNLERMVRLTCRDRFRETRLLQRIVPDMQKVLAVPDELLAEWAAFLPDNDPALPTDLWTPSVETEAAVQAEVAEVEAEDKNVLADVMAEAIRAAREQTRAGWNVTPAAPTAKPAEVPDDGIPRKPGTVLAFSIVRRDGPDDREDEAAKQTKRWNALWDDWTPEEVSAPFVLPGYRFRPASPTPPKKSTRRSVKEKQA